jgi:hypothetical protein
MERSWTLELAAQSARSYHVVSLQTSAASPYDLDIKVISTTHASIFANSAALAGTSWTIRAKLPLMRPSLQPRRPPPSRRKAFALAVLEMRAPILAPIVAMALNPRAPGCSGGVCREASIRPVAQPNRSSATRPIDNYLGGFFLHWLSVPFRGTHAIEG